MPFEIVLFEEGRDRSGKQLRIYGKPDCQASKSVAKHLVAVDADDGHH